MKRPITVLGRYEILDEIGQSASAHVYRALDTELDRLILLKEVRPAPHNFAACVKRFHQEVSLLAQLDHPHIVKIYDVREKQGRLLIVMRLVDGPDLKDLIARQGYLSWLKALAITTAVVEGLDCAHQHRILHQNLKPTNILIDRQQGPMLSDFGLNKLVGLSSTRLSSSGDIMGPAHYYAPEVWEGHGTSRQSDIYALGCVLYEMLTGDKAFKGRTAAQVVKAHFSPLRLPEVWPESVPVGVADVLRTALARNRDDRYQTAAEMDRDLRDVFGVSPEENLAYVPVVTEASAPTAKEVGNPKGPIRTIGRADNDGGTADEAEAGSSSNGATTDAHRAKKQSVVPILVGAGAVGVVLIVVVLVAFFALSSFVSPDTEVMETAIAAETPAAVTATAITAVAVTKAVLAPTQTSAATTTTAERIAGTEVAQATRDAALVGDLLATFQAATAEAQAATPETIASFTSTPMPSTNTPSFTPDEDIIFAEYFDSDASGWSTGEFEDDHGQFEMTIEDGTYTLTVTAKPEQTINVDRTLPIQEFSDFVLSIEATPHDSAEHYSYGLVFRENASGHHYTFDIGNDGLYGVSFFDGDWVMLKDLSSSDGIKAGQTNTLTVIANGETLTFFVNEEELTTVKDETLTEGQVGLAVDVYEEDTSATVSFDNLIVKSAQ